MRSARGMCRAGRLASPGNLPARYLSATTQIQRSDFDVLKWGHVALAAGGFMVPDAVRVTLEIEAVRDEQS